MDSDDDEEDEGVAAFHVGKVYKPVLDGDGRVLTTALAVVKTAVSGAHPLLCSSTSHARASGARASNRGGQQHEDTQKQQQSYYH